jgi:tetratricopeptide (TPR) repeat protein
MGRFGEAQSLLERFRQQCDLQAITACIEIYEALLAETNSPTDADAPVPSLQPDSITEARRPCVRRYHILIQHACALLERYSHTGRGSDLDAAMEHGQAALATCGTESVLCPTVLVIHASILEKNFRRTSNYDQLRMAESMCRQSLGLYTTACALNTTTYHTLGWIMCRLYEGVGKLAYLDEALNLQRRALEWGTVSHDAEDHQYLRALAACTIWRYKDVGDPQDMDDAVSLLEQALEHCPEKHINRILIAQSVINTVLIKYNRFGRLEDLNKGIYLGRKTMAIPNFRRGDRHLGFLNALANLLICRYQGALSSDSDLEESLNLRREALQCVSTGNSFRWVYAGNLADNLYLRFMRKGELQDLEESIELSRHSIDLLPEGHPERPKRSSRLSAALCQRFYETRDATDLNEALISCRYAMAAMSPLHLDYGSVLLATITLLCMKFEVFQEVDDLDQAILLSESLRNTIPDGHIFEDDTIRHLAKALLLRGAYTNAREDVDRAIRVLGLFRERLAQSAAAAEASRTLAASYLVRFRLNKDPVDAAHALDITNDLLYFVGPSHYERFQCLIHAAELYSERGTPFRDSSIALKHIAEAISSNCRDVRSKIQGAKGFLDNVKAQYKTDWTTASQALSVQLLDAYMSTINLLPQVAFFGLRLHSRLQSLAMGQSIALDGAAHALNISFPERALEMLEQGRVTFWNHTLRLRSPFDCAPNEFRYRLGDLARQLDKSSDILHVTQDPRAVEKEARRRRQQSEEFNSLVDQVRCIPGMERFLLHDEYATLAKAADRGPIVVLVSSALGCHAVVVKSADDIISIPLHLMSHGSTSPAKFGIRRSSEPDQPSETVGR